MQLAWESIWRWMLESVVLGRTVWLWVTGPRSCMYCLDWMLRAVWETRQQQSAWWGGVTGRWVRWGHCWWKTAEQQERGRADCDTIRKSVSVAFGTDAPVAQSLLAWDQIYQARRDICRLEKQEGEKKWHIKTENTNTKVATVVTGWWVGPVPFIEIN